MIRVHAIQRGVYTENERRGEITIWLLVSPSPVSADDEHNSSLRTRDATYKRLAVTHPLPFQHSAAYITAGVMFVSQYYAIIQFVARSLSL